jgi:predicted metalloprotease with PDZ domain
MHCATWLRRAGWLMAIGIALSAGRSLLADDAAAAREQAPAAKKAAPADEPTPSKEAAEPKGTAKKVAKSQGRVLIPKYRLGAALAPVPSALNEKLNLKGEGLLVERVAPGGPADKAGIKRDDILLAVGDKPIKQYADLVEGSNASGGKLLLKVLRDGKTSTVTVTLDKHRKGDEKIFVPSTGAVDPQETKERIYKKLK